MLQQLDICQKALSNFLEDKRSAFPRFYFIGDDDLLEVLIESICVVQPEQRIHIQRIVLLFITQTICLFPMSCQVRAACKLPIRHTACI